jgi:eukaryotic-like serine/threonine-protein kinase
VKLNMELKQRIGDYEVIEQLGRGGMGSVYRVRSLISDRVEAMKVLLPDLVGRQDLAARFEREIKVLAALDHPNIAQLRTALKLDNQLVMIMEFVGGQSLAERVKRGPIPTSEALAYIDQMLNALTYAHAQGVIHRDIKPANMMLTPEGVVKLTDFGVARSQNYEALTATGTTTGSLAYMSPEQINGGAVDARSDLYSLGISLYEMVTGRRPFRANSDFAMMSAQLKEQPRPPIELRSDLNPQLNEIILRALAKNPTERFQSASEFRTALLGVRQPATDAASPLAPTVSGRPVAIPSIPPGHPPLPQAVAQPQKEGIHPGWYVASGGALVIVAMVATGVYLRRAAAEPGREFTLPPALDAPSDSPAAPPSLPAAPEPTASTPTSSSVPTATDSPPTNEPGSPPSAGSSTSRQSSSPPSTSDPQSVTPRVSNQRPPTRQSEAPPQGAEPAAQVGGAGASVDLDLLETEIDQLFVRAGAVERGLDVFQQQQANQGLGLRGDMAARQESMKLNLSRAQQAMERRDGVRAQRFKTLAERDVEALERFLGR